jgi:hypothetical protein
VNGHMIKSKLLEGTSEELTDWEEDFESSGEDEYIQFENLDQIRDRFAVDCEERTSLTLIKPTLEQAKQALIDRLTRQFWSNFHRYLDQNYPLSVRLMPQTSAQDDEARVKRGHEEEDVRYSTFHINDGRGPKRLRATPSASEFSETRSKFTCPYRKHDPRKYGVPNWGPCALTPLQTVARVKLVTANP